MLNVFGDRSCANSEHDLLSQNQGPTKGANVTLAMMLIGRNGKWCKRFRKHVQCNPDQSSARRIELLGFDGSYLTLAVWPAAIRPR